MIGRWQYGGSCVIRTPKPGTTGDDTLLGDIYAASLQPDQWPSAMAAVAREFSARSAFLFSSHCETRPDAVLQTYNQAPGMLESFAEYWHTQDEWAHGARRTGRMVRGTVVAGDDLVPHDTLRKTAFYNEFCLPHDIESMLGAVLFDGSEPEPMPFTNLCWYRPPGQAHFEAEHRQRLAALLPHFQRAFRLQRQLRSLVDARVQQALGGLNIASILLDAQCVVHGCNESGNRLLGAAPPGAVRFQQLRVLGQRCAPSMAEAVARCRGGVPVQVVACLAAEPPQVVAATLMRLPPDSPGILGAAAGEMFLLLVPMPRQGGLEAATAAAPLFGLSRSETRVLAALMDGLDSGAIVSALGLTIATVRTHIRNLLGKTGAHSQQELLRMLRGLGY